MPTPLLKGGQFAAICIGNTAANMLWLRKDLMASAGIDTVGLRSRPDRVHLFNPQTGARLNSLQVEQHDNG